MLDFRILGTFEVLEDDQPLTLGSPRQRALLAILVLRRGEVLSSDRLIDELWGEQPPSSAIKIVQGCISQLRKILGEGVLITRGGRYQLAVAPDQLDAERFSRLADAGREALAAGDPAMAVELFASGLSLWRGDALADFAYERFAQSEAARMEEERLGALEDRIDAELALARHHEITAELEDLCRHHPYRERLLSQLMIALYRDGRQADALEAYRTGRQAFGAELGLEPGPRLRALERQILDQDPTLDPPARGPSDTETHPPASTARGRRAVGRGPRWVVTASAAVGSGHGCGGPNSRAGMDRWCGHSRTRIPTTFSTL
ncbi:MAG TPA: AfsR/SARP family transcriptional regulator [Solirubrobacteraceae bacterium]